MKLSELLAWSYCLIIIRLCFNILAKAVRQGTDGGQIRIRLKFEQLHCIIKVLSSSIVHSRMKKLCQCKSSKAQRNAPAQWMDECNCQKFLAGFLLDCQIARLSIGRGETTHKISACNWPQQGGGRDPGGGWERGGVHGVQCKMCCLDSNVAQ